MTRPPSPPAPSRRAPTRTLAWLGLCALLGAACAASEEEEGRAAEAATAARHQVSQAIWSEMIDSEELIVALGPSLHRLASSIENLRLPDYASRSLFDVVIQVMDLMPPSEGASRSLAAWPLDVRTIPASEFPETTAPHALDLLRPLFDRVEAFAWVKLGVLRGRFADPERMSFETDLALSGLAELGSGRLAGVSGVLQLRWKRLPSADPRAGGSWRVAALRAGPLELTESDGPLFREVLDSVVRDAEALRAARHSEHEAHVLRYLRDPQRFVPPTPHFHLPSHDRHPGVAVADVDGNGWDDVYVMPQWGPNLLFLNRGDGSFEEGAAAAGLALVDHCSSAIFADFDNDGDPDVLVGRTLAPSVYLENRDGRFIERADALPGAAMPGLVASLSAVDADGDGLLDVYVSTYAANLLVREVKGQTEAARIGLRPPERSLEAFLPEADALRLHQLVHAPEAHEFLSLPGPPNLLLRNQGHGRFALPARDHPLRVFKNTYQATWADFDADGDPDVYLAHDFSPNQLFRNDGGGVFVDITGPTGTADIGFGMGVSWGDYDRDGRQDLYVTNLYSKAGNRITGFFGELDPSFRKMARGNTLFHNRGDRFEPVSGKEPGKLPVEIAGWSWGGQFGDLNNDGFLDLYALSGYYTAPREVEAEVDMGTDYWRTVVRSDPTSDFGSLAVELPGVPSRDLEDGVSFSGHERNHLFVNLAGTDFADVSAVSGLDDPADARAFAWLDFDRDGWLDLAVVNANRPQLQLFKNELPRPEGAGRFLALRFVGANTGPEAQPGASPRDGYGALATLTLGEARLVREHRAGEGFAAQNGATLLVGIGEHERVDTVAVRWPGGRRQEIAGVAAGTLLSVYEDPQASPDGSGFAVAPYASDPPVALGPPPPATPGEPLLGIVEPVDAGLVHVLVTMATWCEPCLRDLPQVQVLRDVFPSETLALMGIPVDEADTPEMLAAWSQQHDPAYQLRLELSPEVRRAVREGAAALLGREGIPASLVTDGAGRVIEAGWGVPTVSDLRRIMRRAAALEAEPAGVEPPPAAEPPAGVEPPPAAEPPAGVEPPPAAEPPAGVEPPPAAEPPTGVEPQAETGAEAGRGAAPSEP